MARYTGPGNKLFRNYGVKELSNRKLTSSMRQTHSGQHGAAKKKLSDYAIHLNEKQKSVYAMEVKKTRKEMDEIIEKEGYDKARFKILQLLTKLRQLCIDPKIVYENYNGESSKITEVTKVCKEVIANGHKILLFSSFKTAIDILNREFTNEGISTYVIDGSVGAKKRNELVEKFNNDDTNCFLII